jgi:predicted MFS family arabinose efflux permease/quinol monooxygenase YgiN
MYQVGEAWLMTSLTSSPLLVALLQSADSLAIFLFSLPGGALADVMDRRRLAIVTQAWLLVGALALGLLTLGGAVTPWILIGLSFVMGIGAAIDAPVWQAIVPDLVPRSELSQAVALGGVSINVARAIAPALGGLLVAAVGPYAVFFLNAATFVYVIAVLIRWRPPRTRTTLPPERLFGAVQRGLRYVRHSPELVATFFRTGIGLFAASCLLALLPTFARRELSLDSVGYGLLYGCMGAGAVISAALLPKVRTKLSPDATLGAGGVVFALVLLVFASVRSPWLAGGAMLAGGVASMAILSSLNVAVQIATAPWVRARVLSIYMIVFQGAIAVGSVVWGTLAARTSLRIAFIVSGATMLAGSLAGRSWFRLSARAPDFSPSLHWPKPVLVCEPAAEQGPVVVVIEYRVPSKNVKEFVKAAHRIQRVRRRDGAYQWELFRDPAAPDRFIETYMVDSWADHLREHERLTVEKRDAEARLTSLIAPGTQPIITHLIAAHPDAASEA